ncbi:tetratricopeptide repeat protein [Streptomyces wedmorensis]|uniref:Tetratricopeptide repeat protein n=1 Tax=Streptomyces wedmorensis TaxID=43759 RepID=A0ABW6IUY3_STRWE
MSEPCSGGGGGNRGGEQVNNTVSGGFVLHAVIQGRDITVQLPPQVTPALYGLPAASPTFTGRDATVGRLLEYLAPGEGLPGEGLPGGGQRPVLVTSVAGMAGVGKTELAVQAATRALATPGWFPGGVLFIDLFGYAGEEGDERRLSPERALEGLLRDLAVPGGDIPRGLSARQGLYRTILAAYAKEGRRVLVVIDNASSSLQVRPLLPSDGQTAALVTSRHTLDGLNARLEDLDTLGEGDSLALLDAALRHARGEGDTRFRDDDDSARTIARLCAGLPLALQISAALLATAPTRPAASLAAALADGHTRLKRLSRPDRAVRAAFDLSYDLLDGEHAELFHLLPINPGPDVSTEAAGYLADIDPDTAEERLRHLAEAHLIDPVKDDWGRWRMHDLVRLYAESDEHGRPRGTVDQQESARLRLYGYYYTYTVAAVSHLGVGGDTGDPRFRDRRHALSWLDAEHRSLIASATAASAAGLSIVGANLALYLGGYLDDRRYFDDLIALSTMALDIAREHGEERGQAAALTDLGRGLQQVRRLDEAIEVLTEALTIRRGAGDRRDEALILSHLGVCQRQSRRYEEAIDCYEKADAILVELGDHQARTMVMSNLGTAHRQAGRAEEAETCHRFALALIREFGIDRHSEATALNNLGTVLMDRGKFEEAIAAHANAVVIFGEIGQPHRQGKALDNLGNCLREAGRLEEAVDVHIRALNMHRATGDRHGEAMVQNNLGADAAGLRLFEQAVDLYVGAAGVFRELGDHHGETVALDNLAHALQQAAVPPRGLLPAALADAYGTLLEARRRHAGDDDPAVLSAWGSFAHWRGEAGDPEAAAAAFAELLVVMTRVLGEEHPHVRIIRRNLIHFREQAQG